MTDLLVALGLVLVIEGAAYALFPEAMKRMMARLESQPATLLRGVGLGSAVVGFGIVWLLRG